MYRSKFLVVVKIYYVKLYLIQFSKTCIELIFNSNSNYLKLTCYFFIVNQLVAERAAELKRQAEEEGPGVKPKKAVKQPLKVFREGVGKYLNLEELSTNKANKSQEPAKKLKKDNNYKFGSFESW